VTAHLDMETQALTGSIKEPNVLRTRRRASVPKTESVDGLAARRILGNPEDAEDALQDGLLSAYRNVRRFEGRCKFST
jgi:Sigma-70 region 2